MVLPQPAILQPATCNPMYHPTTRLLTVLELLQTHGEISGIDLAARLEVDVRTVRRYITMLQDMAIPIESTRGRHGGYRLEPGYKLPPLMFTTDEALAITLGLVMTRRLGLGVDAAGVEGALAKIERVLPTDLRQRVRAIEEVLIIETPLPDFSPDTDVVVTVTMATQRHEQVWLHYRAFNNSETERTVDPYGVVYREGYWYMAGYCHLRNGLRTFRLDRVLDVQLNGHSFHLPKDFDALTHVEESIASTPNIWLVDVLLDTTLAEARCFVPPTLATPRAEDGGVVLRCYVSDLGSFAYFLLGLPCAVTVREPSELCIALRQLAKRAAAIADSG